MPTRSKPPPANLIQKPRDSTWPSPRLRSVAEALSDRLGRGDITLSRYDIAVRPLDERIAKLKAERAALGVPSTAASTGKP